MTQYTTYLAEVQKYKNTYGENVVVLLQVGAFYEIYSVDNDGIDIKTIGNILNIQVTKRNKNIAEVSSQNFRLCGFPIHCLTKYMNMLVNHKYTVVVLSEKLLPNGKPQRVLTDVRSPGTKVDDLCPNESNYLFTIFIDEAGVGTYTIALAFIDVSTAECSVYETYSKLGDAMYVFDDVRRVLENNPPTEVMLLGNTTLKSQTVCDYMGIRNCYIHDHLNNYDAHISNAHYQNQLLTKVFPDHGILSGAEYVDLECRPNSLAVYVALLQFVQQHNEEITKQLRPPNWLDHHKNVVLGHNTARQLNILPNYSDEVTLLDILNVCKTAIGRRRFKQKLLNPMCDSDALNVEYDRIEAYIRNDACDMVRKNLQNVYDIERMFRRVVLRKAQPTDCILLKTSIEVCQLLVENATATVGEKVSVAECRELLLCLGQVVENSTNMNEFESNFFTRGLYPSLDVLQDEIDGHIQYFHNIHRYFNSIEGMSGFFKLEKNTRDGYHLIVTAKRYSNIQANFTHVLANGPLDLTNLTSRRISQTSTVSRLEHPDFQHHNRELMAKSAMLSKVLKEMFLVYLDSIAQYHEQFHRLIEFIAETDVRSTVAYTAMQRKYSRPSIVDRYDDTSYVRATDIRHPIVEHAQNDVEYIPNTVDLDHNGILLYGINASGKSSLMKSVGISVMLASAGMYVPCSSFTFYPYKHIFTRIPMGDDISKGRSTFTNEIMELRNIIRRSTANSLVIGDELCSGTESVSAMSIVAAGLVTLCERRSSFMFATHLHDLVNIKQVQDLSNSADCALRVYHLGVRHCSQSGELVYDRQLKPGQGSTLYGLEVLKSLDVNDDFIKLANSIRQDIMSIERTIVPIKKSRYNNRLFVDACAVCGEKAAEVHHIKPQHTADKHGNIGNNHKNALHNLVNLCTSCHDEVHHGHLVIHGYIKTLSGTKLNYDKNANT